MTKVNVFAPAKVNLTLHITGQRDDGYHLLDSLVAFAAVGDQLSLSEGPPLSLTIEGPETKGVPADTNNLAIKAARIIDDAWEGSIVLEKQLPAAAGIGGGSADAAAVIRAALLLNEAWLDDNLEAADEALKPFADQVLALGADVPMCLLSRSCRARGIGEKITFVPLPTLRAVLVNPRSAVPTGSVFAALEQRDNPPMPKDMPAFRTADDLITWLAAQRNDLEAPAIRSTPSIGTALDALAGTEGCQLARMSGSGATCFGLYPSPEVAVAALRVLQEKHPDWWIKACNIGDQLYLAEPKFN